MQIYQLLGLFWGKKDIYNSTNQRYSCAIAIQILALELTSSNNIC